MERLKDLLAQIQNWWAPVPAWFARLSARERKLVLLTGSVATLFLIFVLSVSFAASARGYRRRTTEKLEKLVRIQELASTYQEQRERRAAAERQLTGADIGLNSYIDQRSKEAGIEISSTSPKSPLPLGDGKIIENAIELSMTEVDLRRFVVFLTSLENAPNGVVKVKWVQLEPRPEREALSARTTLATYQLKK